MAGSFLRNAVRGRARLASPALAPMELEDDDPAEDDGLREPSLGSVAVYAHSDQRAWAAGGRRDF
jgi:hypothetical protein